jgi:hypothetical protein
MIGESWPKKASAIPMVSTVIVPQKLNIMTR